MANVAFSKLGLKKNQDEKDVFIVGKDGEQISINVKQYLPISEKLEIVTNVINACVREDTNYMNPIEVDMWFDLEVIFRYTNLSFTEKQKEEIDKLYDLLCGNGVIAAVRAAMCSEEFNELQDGLRRTVSALYAYRNSAVGILETISTDYKNLDYDVTQLQAKLADPDNMNLLRNVLTKLG